MACTSKSIWRTNVGRVGNNEWLKFLNYIVGGYCMSGREEDTPRRSYDRSWQEIEDMLERAIAKRNQWKMWFEESKKNGDREGMKDAARNHKALDGVVKTLQWTLGQEGVEHPLD